MYYSSFGLLSIIVHVIINIRSMRKPREGEASEVKEHYRAFLYGVLLYYVTDVFWGTLYELRIVPIVYADTVLYFLSMGLSLLLWMRFVVSFLDCGKIAYKSLTHSAWLIFVFEIVTLIINLFVPIMFSFDESGEYIPGRARYINLIMQIVLFAAISVYPFVIIKKKSGQERLHYKAISISSLMMLIFIILQMLYPLLPFYAIGCLLATCIIHTFIIMDDKVTYDKELGTVKKKVFKDPLTGVKSVHAYTDARVLKDKLLKDGELEEFGVIVFDVNNLKVINDTFGHDAGDKYIREASKLICNSFKRSPVYRIGGDEFVAFLEGEDYINREELVKTFNSRVKSNLKSGRVTIACGYDVFIPGIDTGYDKVFERADNKMYQRKKQLKGD